MRKFTAVVLTGLISACGASAFAATKLVETGSTLLYPLTNLWVSAYQQHHAGVQITTQGTGSGAGISQAISGVAQIGASDAYMSDSQERQLKMLNIPLAISAQQINYNIPGLNNVHLNFSGPVLAGIYNGGIQYWDDSKIEAINRQYASKLPHQHIIPIHRADGSGDTFIFTQYLSFSTPSWNRGPGYGTTVSWPSVSGGVGATGNPGMVQACQGTQYSIAYIGVSFLNQTNAAHLGYAQLQNRSGKFVLPAPSNISSAANALSSKTPGDERISLVFAPGPSSYPIVNYEYAIVNPRQSDGATKAALQAFLRWAVSSGGGNSMHFLNSVHFLPLPGAIRKTEFEPNLADSIALQAVNARKGRPFAPPRDPVFSVQSERSQGLLRFAFGSMAAISVAIVALILIFLIHFSFQAIKFNGLGIITSGTWNIGNQYASGTITHNGVTAEPGAQFGGLVFILGTIASSALALAGAVPLAILVALALVYRIPRKIRPAANSLVELMAGVPSVVYGLWGVVVLVPWIAKTFAPSAGSGYGLLAAAVVLLLMILPIMAATMRDVITAQTPAIFEASMALGSSSWQAVTRAVIPSVRTGMVASVLVALGRALGETMAVLMVCGAAINTFPSNVFQPVNTIAAVIVSQLDSALTDSSGIAQKSLAELALLLFIITLTVNMIARAALRGGDRGAAEG